MRDQDSTHPTLLLRLRNRTDEVSWQEFHERYGELLVRYARTRGASAVDAEDIVQDVELYLFKAMEGFEYDTSKGRFRTYLRSAVVHAMARKAKKQARQGEVLDPQVFDYLTAGQEADQDDRWEREWRLHRLRWALRAIAQEVEPLTLEAFRLHVLAGRPVTEAAAELGMSTASVYQAKSRILKRVKQKLESLDPEEDV
ncbi:MAG: sigma-70 family RNA polymerase sigma factor [Planctomycetota bacterium]